MVVFKLVLMILQVKDIMVFLQTLLSVLVNGVLLIFFYVYPPGKLAEAPTLKTEESCCARKESKESM